MDITADVNETLSIALGDVDRDGTLDVVAGNGGTSNQPNRLYRNPVVGVYHTAHGWATSLRVDTETDPFNNVTLAPTATLPANTDVDFWVSNNGGLRWFLARPGVRLDFPTSGTDLRWRAELHSLSPVLTPSIDQILLERGPQRAGDRVWEDLDGDGVQDAGEPGVANVLVGLYDDLGNPLDATITDGNGNFSLGGTLPAGSYFVQFAPPFDFVLTLQNLGGDDALDSDADPVTWRTSVFTFSDLTDETKWDAGLIPFCFAPDEPVFISGMRLTTDGNNYPILDFQDPNQPSQITGYNIYRADDPVLVFDPASLFASDIIDMDEATANKQWVDTSGDVPRAASGITR